MSTTKKIQLISGLPQTDWNETDETKPSYLKNKPTALPCEGGNADTVNNHTVNADVPADAVFTDTVYTHPTSSGNKHIPSGGSSGQILRWSADGTAAWGADNNNTYSVATTSVLGLVKSGTDITVDSSGNVSVNDDSHNHVISNVDGLQDALDGKAASSHNQASNTINAMTGYSKPSSASAISTSDTLNTAIGKLEKALDGKQASGSYAASNHTHSAYVNQNAFSNVVVGSTTIAADSSTDTLTLVAGNNVTLTPDATNDKVTIAATDTVYTHPTSGITVGTYKSVTVDDKGHVTAGTNPTTLAGYGITDAAKASDLSSHTSNKSNPHSVTKAQVGLGNVENKSSATIRGEITSSNVTTALGYTPLNSTLKGANNGLAELDSTGKVPSSQLPSYVDDCVEGYLYNSKLYKESGHTTEITGETGKIYIDLPTNKTYRWSGSAYTEISASLALGETSSTAYRGDRGKIAYDHSQTAHAPSNAEKNIIVGVQKNGTDLTIDGDRKVNIPVPTKTSELDNDSGFITTSDIPEGAAASTTTPKVAGTAAIGTELAFARGDHVHPAQTSVSGNAGTATKLATARTITLSGDVSGSTTFDGSGDVTITATVADDSHNHTINNVDGLQAALDGKAASSHTHSAYVNQNAFSKVVVGSTTVAADSATDTLTLVAGSNVTLTPDATNDKITIAATNTTYNAATTSVAGLMSAADKTKLDGIASEANNYSLPTASSSTLGGVKVGTNLSISNGVLSATDTTYNVATTSANGLMSSSDKSKLNGIATGAEVNQNAFSKIAVESTIGSGNIEADSKTDTLTIVAGQNIVLTPDATNDKLTIAAAYDRSTATTSEDGLMSSSDKSKLDGIAANANNYSHPTYTARTGKPTANATPKFGDTFTVSQITSNGTGHVTGATDRTIKIPSSTATTSAAGLMSASDKTKLNGIASNAQENVIEAITVNGVACTPSSKSVEITVPTALKNPYALTITQNGTSTSYDGSEAINISLSGSGEAQNPDPTYLYLHTLDCNNCCVKILSSDSNEMQNVDESSIVSIIGYGAETPSVVIPFYDGSVYRIMTMEYGGDGTLSNTTFENVADLNVAADTVVQIL